jgi:hypothetical protein
MPEMATPIDVCEGVVGMMDITAEAHGLLEPHEL